MSPINHRTVLLFVTVLHAVSPFKFSGLFQKFSDQKPSSPPDNKPIPNDFQKVSGGYTGQLFIIRQREPRADNNTETGYEAFVTTGGIHETRPTSLAMAKNNMGDPRVRDHDSNSDVENSELFGVVVNSETVGKLQLSDSLRINVTLNSLLKAATSRMPWLLVLQRKKFKEMFVDLGQKRPEKETAEKPEFADRRSQPEVHVLQPHRRQFQFIRHRRDVNLHSEPTPFFLVPEMQRMRETYSHRPENAEISIDLEPRGSTKTTDESKKPLFFFPAVENITQAISPPPSFATIEPRNHQFSSSPSPVSPTETMFNHESSIFRTEVTNKEVVSSTPYVTSTETVDYHLSSSLLPTIAAENIPEYNPISPTLPKNEIPSKKSSILPSKIDEIQANSSSPDLTASKNDDHKLLKNSSSLFPNGTTNKTTTNSSSPDNYPTGSNDYRLRFPSSILFPESIISEVNSPISEFFNRKNQFNSSPPVVLTPTAVVSNEQHLTSSTATKTTKIQSGPYSSATNYGGIINFKDNEDEKVIPLEHIERLIPISSKHTTKEYRQLTPFEELPKPEAFTDIIGFNG